MMLSQQRTFNCSSLLLMNNFSLFFSLWVLFLFSILGVHGSVISSSSASSKSSPGSSSSTASITSDGTTSTFVEGDVIITSETSDCPCSHSISQQFAIKRVGGKKGDPIVITKRSGSCCDKDHHHRHSDHDHSPSPSSSSPTASLSPSSKLVPVPVPVPISMYRPYFYHPQPSPSHQLIQHHILPNFSPPTAYPETNYQFVGHHLHQDTHSSPSISMPMPMPLQHHYPSHPHTLSHHHHPSPPPPSAPYPHPHAHLEPSIPHHLHHHLHPSPSASEQNFWSYENRPFYSDPGWSLDDQTMESALMDSRTIQDKKSHDYDYDDPFPTNLDLWD